MTDIYTALANPTTKVSASLDTGATITSLHPALHVEEREMLESLRVRTKTVAPGASAYVFSNYFRGSTASPTGYTKIGNSGASGLSSADFTWQCDGVGDNVELQAAIDKVALSGGGSVAVIGPLFLQNASIQRRTGVKVFGEGRGTIIRASADFTGPNYGQFMLFDDTTHASELSGLTLDGDSKNCFGIWDQADGGEVFSTPDPDTNPDAFNITKDLYIYGQGDSAFAGHGLRTSGGNLRACRYINIRMLAQSGCGLWVDSSVDSHYEAIDVGSAGGTNSPAGVQSDTAPVGYGAYINGDDNYFGNSKMWFSDMDGWYVGGVRNNFWGMGAQDNGGYGVNMASGWNDYSGIKCDSNGRSAGAGGRGRDGINCQTNYNNVKGLSYDKGEAGGAGEQQYGIRMSGGTQFCDISLVTRGNVLGASTGTAAVSSRVWISAQS